MNVLVTGRPGVGKTTVVEAVISRLPRRGIVGFITREIRQEGERRGFSVETLDGGTAMLAHVDRGGGPRVGRYGVDLRSVDRVAVPAVEPRPGTTLVVIDEIGKMECLSPRFRDAVRRALDAPLSVLATIPLRGGGFIDEVRRRKDVTLFEVTRRSRDGLPERIAAALTRTRCR